MVGDAVPPKSGHDRMLPPQFNDFFGQTCIILYCTIYFTLTILKNISTMNGDNDSIWIQATACGGAGRLGDAVPWNWPSPHAAAPIQLIHFPDLHYTILHYLFYTNNGENIAPATAKTDAPATSKTDASAKLLHTVCIHTPALCA